MFGKFCGCLNSFVNITMIPLQSAFAAKYFYSYFASCDAIKSRLCSLLGWPQRVPVPSMHSV